MVYGRTQGCGVARLCSTGDHQCTNISAAFRAALHDVNGHVIPGSYQGLVACLAPYFCTISLAPDIFWRWEDLGIPSSSPMLKDCFRTCFRDHAVLWIEIGLAVCKASTLATIPFLWQ